MAARCDRTTSHPPPAATDITQYIVRLCVNYEQQRRVALYIKLLYCFPIFTFIDLKQLFKVTEIISKFLLVDDLSL